MKATYNGTKTAYLNPGQTYELHSIPESETDINYKVTGIPGHFRYGSEEQFEADWQVTDD